MSVLGDGEMLPADAKERGEGRGQRFMETRRPACPPAVTWPGLVCFLLLPGCEKMAGGT